MLINTFQNINGQIISNKNSSEDDTYDSELVYTDK
jgi:hypothetical protein